MFNLPPAMSRRLHAFGRLRRARWSLWLLAALFVLSLAAELVANSRPLLLRYGGRTCLPFLHARLSPADLAPGADAAGGWRAFVRSAAFRADPSAFVLWAPVRWSPGDVADAAELADERTVRVSVVPETRVARCDLLADGRFVRGEGMESFVPPGAATLAGLGLGPAFEAAVRDARAGGLRAPRDLSGRLADGTAFTARVRPAAAGAATVRVSLRAAGAAESPFLLVFRRAADGTNVVCASGRAWDRVPAAAREPLRALAAEGFRNTAPKVSFGWRSGRRATASAALVEVGWPFRPVRGHPFGIDAAGRDVFARVLYGMRIALLFGLVLAFWAMAGGLAVGAVEGYFGGWVDIAGQRLTEIWNAVPFLYVMIFIGATVGRSFMVLLVCYSLFNWIVVSYYVRAEFLRLRSRPFVEAARCQGFSDARIIFGHILPNALTPLVTLFPFLLMGAIGSLAALDFLGFGLPPLTPSWGELLGQAEQFRGAWWLILFPSAALFAVMLLTVLVGEGLREAFDPRRDARIE